MKKLTIAVMACLITGVLSVQAQYTVEKSTKPAKKDYRIERQSSNTANRVKIMSPEGRVLRNFLLNEVKVAKRGNYLIHRSMHAVHEDKGYVETENNLYNVKGEKKWTRKFRSYPANWDPEVLDPSVGEEGISDEGERSYYNWRDEEGNYCVAVYDEAGKELAKSCISTGLYNIEISPDGKLVGANTYIQMDGKSVKHLFFLDVDTNKTKLVKAEGWRYVISNGGPLIPGKILLRFGGPGAGYKRIYLEFDALPKDLVVLLSNEASRK